MPVGER